MKKIYFTIFFLFCVIFANAQKDVTKFLGIPVDGSKSEMRRKLISKGFTPKTVFGEEHLEGEFNGTDVYVMIGTNNNKVWRIAVVDQSSMDEKDIKNRFNRLVSQFKKNERYIDFRKDFTIPEEENVSTNTTGRPMKQCSTKSPMRTRLTLPLFVRYLKKKYSANIQKKNGTIFPKRERTFI